GFAISFPVFAFNSFKSDLFRQPGSSFLNFYALYSFLLLLPLLTEPIGDEKNNGQHNINLS
ncbi:hypothetical protein XU19_23850, partial [Vibrio parahaemolyticus]